MAYMNQKGKNSEYSYFIWSFCQIPSDSIAIFLNKLIYMSFKKLEI